MRRKERRGLHIRTASFMLLLLLRQHASFFLEQILIEFQLLLQVVLLLLAV
jgi:hypothetical protein